ncbi:hypothetical protein Rcae01_03041 [Novipirellula caenicola]|uniref:Uncharacterized protein n=1 Tax=Novipirellula caenicola TaxID=1536901 RepID=A0ABP9VQZ1_9BACT
MAGPLTRRTRSCPPTIHDLAVRREPPGQYRTFYSLQPDGLRGAASEVDSISHWRDVEIAAMAKSFLAAVIWVVCYTKPSLVEQTW